MEIQNYSIQKLYRNYNKTKSSFFKDFLSKIFIVKQTSINSENVKIYSPLNKYALDGLIERPRLTSLKFGKNDFVNYNIINLTEYKLITYLVKDDLIKNSTFSVNPNIGQIIDQISSEDIFLDEMKAICFDTENYKLISDTEEGKHYLMQAILLK